MRQWHAKRIFSGLFACLLGGLLLIALPKKAVAFSLASVPVTPVLLAPSVASLHTYQERPGQTTFRSKQSLRDRRDRSWQVILFKRYQQDELQGLYLRLVGFPGLVTLDSQKPISVATGSSLQWQVPPELDPQTTDLPENAAQYNMAKPLNALDGDIPLQIDIPLAGGSIAELVVPPFAVHEWRELVSQVPAS